MTKVLDILGNKNMKKTTKKPTSTVNITGLFFTRYRGSSFNIESKITFVSIEENKLPFLLSLLLLFLFFVRTFFILLLLNLDKFIYFFTFSILHFITMRMGLV